MPSDTASQSFNALDHVVIEDNFFPDPDAVRAKALTRSYQEPPPNTPRIAVTSICNDLETQTLFTQVKPWVQDKPSDPVVGVRVLYRYSLADANKKVFCHVDGCSYAGIVYLSRPEDCAGGTSIYRHRPTRDEIYDRNHRQQYDFNDPEQWEVLTEIDMQYNRLVMYPGQLFHAITPVFFGDSIENARLTQNIFIFRQHDRSLM